MEFPARGVGNSIVVDTKKIGIWDVINLGHKGGVINLSDRYALEMIKSDQKWGELRVLQYGVGATKRTQQFTPVKRVVDTEQVSTLRTEVNALKKLVTGLEKENTTLKVQLSQHNVAGQGSAKKDEVHEL